MASGYAEPERQLGIRQSFRTLRPTRQRRSGRINIQGGICSNAIKVSIKDPDTHLYKKLLGTDASRTV